MASDNRKLVVLPAVTRESDISPEAQVSNVQLNIGVANDPVLAGNYMTISAEGCPGAKIAAAVFEQHHHYGTETPAARVEPVFDDIKEKLKNTYSRLWMKPLPFLDGKPLKNFYVELNYEFWDLTGRRLEKKNKKMSEVIREISTNKRYVLVMGGSGCGKTIFLTKIAYDWATGEESSLAGYDIVLFYKLRNLPKGTLLEEELKVEILRLFGEQRDSTEDERILDKFRTKKSLLLLDGYDELDDDGQRSLRDVLDNSCTFFKSTFIVTSRDEENSEFLQQFQLHIRFTKLTKKDTDKIIEKYFSTWSEKSKADQFKKFVENNKLQILFQQSPLLLFVFCVNFEKSTASFTWNISNLIPEMLRNMLIRQIERNGETASEKDIEDIMKNIGELFWKKLQQNTCVFPVEELKTLYKETFPLIMSLQLFQPSEIENTYEPLHKSFMDSLACNYLNTNMKQMKNTTEQRKEIGRFTGSIENIKIQILQGEEIYLVLSGLTREIKYVIKNGSLISEGNFEIAENCNTLGLKSSFIYWDYDRTEQRCSRLDKDGGFTWGSNPFSFLRSSFFFFTTQTWYHIKEAFPFYIGRSRLNTSYQNKYIYSKECWGNLNRWYERFELSCRLDEESGRVDLNYEPDVPFTYGGVNVNYSLNDFLSVMFCDRKETGESSTVSKWLMKITFRSYSYLYDYCSYRILKE